MSSFVADVIVGGVDDAVVDAGSVTDSVTDSDSDSMAAVVRYLYW